MWIVDFKLSGHICTITHDRAQAHTQTWQPHVYECTHVSARNVTVTLKAIFQTLVTHQKNIWL